MDGLDPVLRAYLAAGFYAAGYVVAIALFWWMARRRGVATQGFAFVAWFALVGGALGAVGAQHLVTQDQGRCLEGGLFGGFLAVVLVKRLVGITRPTGDLFAVALAGGEAVGRLGCFFGGCCYGKAATVAWAVHDHGVLRHPTQLYSALAAAATLALLLRLERLHLPEDSLLAIQGLLFCTARATIDIVREGAPVWHVAGHAMPLTIVQSACIAGVIFFLTRLHAVAPDLLRLRSPRPRALAAAVHS